MHCVGSRKLTYSSCVSRCLYFRIKKEQSWLKQAFRIYSCSRDQNSSSFYSFATMAAALEQLVDAAREVKDNRAKTFARVILRQCRSLVDNPVMKSVLIKLVSGKGEAEVARIIDETVRRQSSLPVSDYPYPAPRVLARTRWSRLGRGRGW